MIADAQFKTWYGTRLLNRFSLAAVVCIVLTAVASPSPAEPPQTTTVTIVGDIMLSRNVALKMKKANDPLLPFRNVTSLLDSSDLNFGNLESPFAPPEPGGSGGMGGTEPAWDGIIGGKSLVFAAPNRSVPALARYRFRVLALANNHALDQKESGLAHTLERLSANGIQAAGAGGNLAEAWQPRIVESKGIKIAFMAVSYASLNYGTDERNPYVARMQDLDRLTSSLHLLKPQADCIIVAMHAGDEYTAKPSPGQVECAHAAIDAGAHVVVGSHPHWIQPFESYRGGLIFYSLGNFVFDLDSSVDTREGAAVRLVIGKHGITQAEVHPVEIENSCCPRPAGPAEIGRVLRRMHLKIPQIVPASPQAGQ